MASFAAVSRFPEGTIKLPERKTKYSAGYDFEVAEDILIPSYWELMEKLKQEKMLTMSVANLDDVAALTKSTKAKPSLISTGVKCYLAQDEYLELSVRSSCPLKHWLILANSVGIIDADYCDNPDNEGEIFFQMINLAPFPIQLHKGDVIGQGIIKKYITTTDDKASGDRLGGFGSTSKQQGQLKKDLNSSYAIGNQSSAASQYSQAEGFNSLAQAVGASGITFNEALEAVKAAAQQCKQGIIDEISDSITYALGGKSNDEITRFRSKF